MVFGCDRMGLLELSGNEELFIRSVSSSVVRFIQSAASILDAICLSIVDIVDAVVIVVVVVIVIAAWP